MNIHDFDWRMYGVTTLSKDLPAAGPGAPFHPAGTPVYSSTFAEWDSKKFMFGTPSSIKIAFNIALTASCEAVIAKEHINIVPYGDGVRVKEEEFPHLYNYFEKYMAAVVFSSLTLEMFCNFVIDSKLGKNTVFLQLDKKPKHYNATELQRDNVSVLKKLLVILPKILNISSIETNNPTLWGKFKDMTLLRNKITHMKPLDVYRGASIDRDSIYAEIINGTSVNFPFYTLKIMDYYKSGLTPVFWIEEMNQQYITRFQDIFKNYDKIT